jgi:tetratricopeptide (TPR) repeat protein
LHGKTARVLETAHASPSAILAIHYDLAGADAAAFNHAVRAALTEEAGYGEWEFFWQLALRAANSADEISIAREGLLKALLAQRRYEDAQPYVDALLPEYELSGNELGQLLATHARLGYMVERGSINASEAAGRFEAAADAAYRMGQMEHWIESGTYLLSSAHDAGSTDLVRRWAATLLKVAGPDIPARVNVRLYTLVGRIYSLYGDVESGMRLTHRAIDLAANCDATSRCNALMAHGMALLCAAELVEAERVLLRAKEMAQAECPALFSRRVENDLCMLYLEKGCYSEVVETMRKLIATGYSHDTLSFAGNMAIAHYELGQYAECKAAAELMLEVNERVNAVWVHYSAYAFLGLAAIKLGDMPQADVAYAVVEEYSRYAEVTVIGDDRYIHVFAAQYLEKRDGTETGLGALDVALPVVADRDRLGALRLCLERARLLAKCDQDAAWREARRVAKEASRCGATALAEMASDLLADVSWHT